MGYKTKYLLMQEVAWPRILLVEIAQEFMPQALKRKSSLRKFRYIKQSTVKLYDKFSKYHDNEISLKSWTMLFKHGFKMKCARQEGSGFFYAGPESIRIFNNLLRAIPKEGGFFYDGKKTISVVNSLDVPEIRMPDIIIKKETEIDLNRKIEQNPKKMKQDFNNLHETINQEKKSGQIIRG